MSFADLTPLQIFMMMNARFSERYQTMEASGRGFVHYTTADAALSMVRTEQVWMRKSIIMNDFMELEHGFDCLTQAYVGHTGKRFNDILDGIFPGLSNEIDAQFKGWLPDIRENTYITSISEHNAEEEDDFGRLSMWRAYGAVSGVAIVMNPRAFLAPSDALSAWSYPVEYLNPDQFRIQFEKITAFFEASRFAIASLGRESVKKYIVEYFRLTMMTTKHPVFGEEREWRVVHSPNYHPSSRLVRDIESVRGSPQIIYKIPLRDIPEEGLVGASLPGLIRRVIIGPSYDASAIREAFIALLQTKGVDDARAKVVCSNIPLRQH